jgi:hypothetical protein
VHSWPIVPERFMMLSGQSSWMKSLSRHMFTALLWSALMGSLDVSILVYSRIQLTIVKSRSSHVKHFTTATNYSQNSHSKHQELRSLPLSPLSDTDGTCA